MFGEKIMDAEEKILMERISKIKETDKSFGEKAKAFQQTLAMPPGSLGRLQEIAVQLSCISQKLFVPLQKRRIIVLCADNGIVQEGVSVTPQSVTLSQAENMTQGKTGMSSLARFFGDEVQVVDVGMIEQSKNPLVLDKHIRRGTESFLRKEAFSKSEAIRAILLGMDLAKEAKTFGISLLGTGEMGIGNTSTSAAVLCALTEEDAEKIVGRGSGLSDLNFAHKKSVIKEALSFHRLQKNSVLEIMHTVGGLDIAAMCGVFLGAAEQSLPIVIDGFISVVAALCAYRLTPVVKDYIFASHESAEPGFKIACKEIGITPYLNLQMRLGEGSGCPLAFQILLAAEAMMSGMASFSEAAIDSSYLKNL